MENKKVRIRLLSEIREDMKKGTTTTVQHQNIFETVIKNAAHETALNYAQKHNLTPEQTKVLEKKIIRKTKRR